MIFIVVTHLLQYGAISEKDGFEARVLYDGDIHVVREVVECICKVELVPILCTFPR